MISWELFLECKDDSTYKDIKSLRGNQGWGSESGPL